MLPAMRVVLLLVAAQAIVTAVPADVGHTNTGMKLERNGLWLNR